MTDTSAIVRIQEEIVRDFAVFDDWSSRYQYLIDLGRQVPPFPEAWKTPNHRVSGCQSQLWLVVSGTPHRVRIDAASDSAIVSGLIALVRRVYDGQPAAAVSASEPQFIQGLGLSDHLVSTRLAGLNALIAAIKDRTNRIAAQAPESGGAPT